MILTARKLGGRVLRFCRLRPPLPGPTPTVFHVTHHKAGSQWINRIFHTLMYDLVVLPKFETVPTHERPVDGTQFLQRPVEAGKVYPTLYVTREQFDSVRIPHRWTRFVVIRDLRDTLVSAYFSLKHSHVIKSEWMQNNRIELNRLPAEDGLLYLLDTWLPPVATFQWSWFASGEEIIKYEELLKNDEEILTRVLLKKCDLRVEPERLLAAIRSNRFEARTGGRKRGEEDVKSHERKGVAGDWRNHFTDKVSAAFRSRYGSLLVATGYEKDERW